MEWKVSDLVEHALSSRSVVWAGRTGRIRAYRTRRGHQLDRSICAL